MDFDLSKRPVVIAIAGPNGAGKSTFFDAHLRVSDLVFINADVLAKELGIGAYEAAEIAERIRQQAFARRESFVFETVLSDPQGEKVEFLRQAAAAGYTVLMFFIGLDAALKSNLRVSRRALEGGHDVPTDKLTARYPRTLTNLARAMKALPCVRVYDNSDLADPYRFIAEYRDGVRVRGGDTDPAWFVALVEPLGSQP